MSLNRDTYHIARLRWNIAAALREYHRAGIRTCRARFPGNCPSCGRAIERSDPLALDGTRWVHLGCHSYSQPTERGDQ